VYCIPGFSGNHLLSTLGDDWKAVRSKLMAEPGPQSPAASVVTTGDTAAAGDSDVAAGDPAGDPLDVAGAGAAFCAEQDATVDIRKNSMSAEPNALGRLWNWNIWVAFRRWNFCGSSSCPGPPWWLNGAALAKPRPY
jgi:hypothetical protein